MKSEESILFEEIIITLTENKIDFDLYDNNTLIGVKNSEIWFQLKESIVRIGYDELRREFSSTFENLKELEPTVKKILSKPIIITSKYRGNTNVKSSVGIKIETNKIEHFSTSLTLIYPFWKKLRIENTEIKPPCKYDIQFSKRRK
ncbi:hypothetical protein [Wenyingzhuangia sp. IMCC45467]